jgi:hypothetical protein
MEIASVPVLLLRPTILLILVILLSMSNSVSKLHDIFLSTYEFIVLKSSPVARFFMFNVIMVIVICHGSNTTVKPSVEDFDWFNSLDSFPHFVYEADAIQDELATCEDYDQYSSDADQEDDDEFHGYDGYDEENDDDDDDDDDDGSEDEQEKDLESRIEEFIAMNYKQRSELLCMAAMVSSSSD